MECPNIGSYSFGKHLHHHITLAYSYHLDWALKCAVGFGAKVRYRGVQIIVFPFQIILCNQLDDSMKMMGFYPYCSLLVVWLIVSLYSLRAAKEAKKAKQAAKKPAAPSAKVRSQVEQKASCFVYFPSPMLYCIHVTTTIVKYCSCHLQEKVPVLP